MQELKTDLESLLVRINEQILAIEDEAAELDITAEQLRTPGGDWPLAQMLIAKAQVAVALANMRSVNVVNVFNRDGSR